MTMAEENVKNITEPTVPGKATITKNILFLVFIVLAIIYCFGKYKESTRLKDFNKATEIYENASKLADEGEPTSLVEYALAREIFKDIYDRTEEDPELNVEAQDMLARVYASMATCPQISAKMGEGYMLLALDACGACPLVSEPMRENFAKMTEDERNELRNFVIEEEKRLFQASPDPVVVPPAAPATQEPAPQAPATQEPAPEN